MCDCLEETSSPRTSINLNTEDSLLVYKVVSDYVSSAGEICMPENMKEILASAQAEGTKASASSGKKKIKDDRAVEDDEDGNGFGMVQFERKNER